EASAGITLSDIECVPRVFSGVVAPHPSVLLPRWLSRYGANPDAARALLLSSEVIICMGAKDTPGAERGPLSLWRLSPEDRMRAPDVEAASQRAAEPKRAVHKLEIRSA